MPWQSGPESNHVMAVDRGRRFLVALRRRRFREKCAHVSTLDLSRMSVQQPRATPASRHSVVRVRARQNPSVNSFLSDQVRRHYRIGLGHDRQERYGLLHYQLGNPLAKAVHVSASLAWLIQALSTISAAAAAAAASPLPAVL